MPRIRVLDEQTINMIAAGEVIENPASVVKELVENAIDAGATEIVIEIQLGGRQLIRISDNGCGMSADDAVLCLERHATSKIRNVDDIQDLMSMGFRGEAIPSVAAISKFTLLTCCKGQEGTLVVVEGGKLLTAAPAARSLGTTIEVKALFFNVPVRKKFQRSPSYDTQEILKMITVLSLGHSHIRFELISDQKSLLDTRTSSGSFLEQLGQRIETVLGKEFLTNLCPLKSEQEGMRVEGFVGLPSFNRQNRTGQYLFINQRPIHSPLISFAVREGYGTMLPTNRYPIFVLHVHLPGSLIDVNVHPQKREVRLRQEQHIKDCLRQATQKALQQTGFVTEKEISIDHTLAAPLPLIYSSPAYPTAAQESTIPSYWTAPSANKTSFTVQETPSFAFIPNKPQLNILTTISGYIILDATSLNATPLNQGQSTNGEGFYLVSQKAAYSRIYYERCMHQESQQTSRGIQPLLLPLTLEFAPVDAALLKEHLGPIKSMGFNIEEFGDHTFVIDAIPDFFKQEELESCLRAIIQDLKELQDTRRLQREKEKSMAVAACRHAKVVSKRLSHAEAQSLITQLMDCQTPMQCPLGKPTMIYLSSDDLAKQFHQRETTCST